MVSVAKFGGTSVGSAEKLMQVASIIKNETPDSKYITVSAPALGEKRMTKMLNELGNSYLNGNLNKGLQDEIGSWFTEIATGVGLDRAELNDEFSALNNSIYRKDISNKGRYIAAIEAAGERMNARCLVAALNKIGLKSVLIYPCIRTNDDYSNAKVISKPEEIRESLLMHNYDNDYAVIPGYYGYTTDGYTATFGRGGTDLTGALLACALNADKYQIFKDDVEGVCSTDPRIVPEAITLEEITYKEMREMAYLGAQVVHMDVMKMCRDSRVPIVVRSTTNLKNPGTRIVHERDSKKNPIVGIAKKDGFTFFTIEQMGMNESVGYLNNVLRVFNEEGISIDHMTTSIDSISLSVHQSQLNGHQLHIYEQLQQRLKPDQISMNFNQSLICVVGEGMKHRIGTFSAISSALAESSINIKTVYQTPSEENVIIGVDGKDSDNAVRALHKEFFVE